MVEYVVSEAKEYLGLIESLSANKGRRSGAFRGVPEYEYELRPSVGRVEGALHPTLIRDLLWLFRLQANPYLDHRSPIDNWDWLALAQHHGLPTPLLDWSRNPLVALYFAVAARPNSDGAVYMHDEIHFNDPREQSQPEACTQVCFILPPHITPRLSAQSGLFTYHPEPQQPLEGPELHKVKIPKAMKAEALDLLESYGIHSASLFPGLDGVASHIRYIKGFR